MIKLGLYNKPIGSDHKHWIRLLRSPSTEYTIIGICDMLDLYEAAASDLGCLKSRVIQISRDDESRESKAIFNFIHNNRYNLRSASLGYYPIEGSEARLLNHKNFKVIQCEIYGHYAYFLRKKDIKKIIKLMKKEI